MNKSLVSDHQGAAGLPCEGNKLGADGDSSVDSWTAAILWGMRIVGAELEAGQQTQTKTRQRNKPRMELIQN